MPPRWARLILSGLALVSVLAAGVAAAPVDGPGPAGGVRVATYNLQNYLCMDRRLEGRFAPRYPKPEREKAAVRATLHAVQPDILCLQEIGPQPFLDELQQDLAQEGLVYPHATLLAGPDPLRRIAVLSRLPWSAVVHHSDLTFAYLDRQEVVKRGLLELRFGSPETWRLFVVHFKSPLTEDRADPQAEIRRTAEARAVRDRILRETSEDPDARYLVVGDLNATPDSRVFRTLIQRGRRVVARPVPARDSRGETWTLHLARSDRYERVDYILASPALWERIRGGMGWIHDDPATAGGSDHRLVWAELAWAEVASSAEAGPVSSAAGR